MTVDPRAKELRQELLDAVAARGEASRRLRHVQIRTFSLGPFGRRKIKKAQAEYNAACKRVTDAFDAWHQSIRESNEAACVFDRDLPLDPDGYDPYGNWVAQPED